MKTLYLTTSTLLFVWALFISIQSVKACRAPLPKPQDLVAKADMIVRATALEYEVAPEGNIRALQEPNDAMIKFRVEEALKGDDVPSTISLYGYLTDKDDFNDRPVPYNFVRRGGRGGACSAYEYKQGAEFLLFLKKIDDKLTVRWYALAPTNEQLRSADDPWVVWVREQLRSSGREGAYMSGVMFLPLALKFQSWNMAKSF